MFRRKEEENTPETETTTEQKAPESVTTSAAAPVSAPVAAAPVAAARPVLPEPKVAPVAAPTPAYRPATPAPAARPAGIGAPAGLGSSTDAAGKKRILTVGNDILLKGEIATCDRLVIEGAVDATLKEVHTVEIAQSGSFKGSAEIEDAEISGVFEGDLIVRNRLIIYSTGKVRGKITYGEIEIERGGELTGEIKTVASAASSSKDSKTKAA